MTDFPTAAGQWLAGRHDLVPGEELSVGVTAALLGGADALTEAHAALAAQVDAGLLVPVDGIPDGPVLPGAPAPRYRRARVAPSDARPPHDGVELEAVERVVRHLLLHATGASEALGPGKYRPFGDELAPLPRFDGEADAMAWFGFEGDTVLAVQRRAWELGMEAETAQFGPACWPWLRVTRRVEDQLAVQHLAAEAAERFDHIAASAAFSRSAWALNALGRPEQALPILARALEVADRHGHDWSRATALTTRGRAYRALKRFDEALADIYAALDIDKQRLVTAPDGTKTAPHTAIGLRWMEIAETHLVPGFVDGAEALRAAGNALTALSRDPRRRRETLRAHVLRGRALNVTGKPDEAVEELRAAEDLADPTTDHYHLAAIKHRRGDALALLRDTERAKAEHGAAAGLYRKAGHHDLAKQLQQRLDGHDAQTGMDSRKPVPDPTHRTQDPG
ncbi:tetratricopeptide repeat protein [Saccharothrix sp.]|uniref:tetratricopeptide repeat protein n=1 Tax=Saccharothrix sp. TaxID=1873460 RepID=UPI002811BA07|nr:tetratricopeptide repeat protein [Saccharothrix sp.]